MANPMLDKVMGRAVTQAEPDNAKMSTGPTQAVPDKISPDVLVRKPKVTPLSEAHEHLYNQDKE